jgi:O-antigen ligase
LGVLRPRLTGAELAVPLAGGTVTVLAAYLAVLAGAEIGFGAVLVVAMFVGAVIGFIAFPHLAVAGTVVLFAFVPMLKVLVSAEVGAVKDLVVLAAGTAALILFVFERRRPDRWVMILVLLLLGLYVVNAGGGHDIAWAQGVRLVGEPLLLLIVGLTLPQSQRTFRFALGALVVTACLVAMYGIIQQAVGGDTLFAWGYQFGEHIRTLPGGQLRSFGTLDDPFAYAALLLFGIAAIFFWLRHGPLAWGAAFLILLGLGVSFVRTAILILVALVGLVLSRWGYTATAVLVVVATVVAGGGILANAGGTQAHTYGSSGSVGTPGGGSSANVILNGRISAWEAALGPDPAQWLLGRGVGEVGTAAERSTYTIAPSSEADEESSQTEAVDSGYLAAIADVGFVGLAVLLALFARLLALAVNGARRGSTPGWVALSLLVALLLDAAARSSFTGFPTAFLGLLLVGVALAAARDESAAAPAGS